MTPTTPSTALVAIQPAVTESERLALVGFLAGVPRPDPSGVHPRPAAVHRWCRTRSLPLFWVRRADIETFARDLEGRGRATAARRLSPSPGSASTPPGRNCWSTPRPSRMVRPGGPSGGRSRVR